MKASAIAYLSVFMTAVNVATAQTFRLIVSKEDDDMCIGVSNNAAAGDRLKIVNCNDNDEDHFWTFDNRGEWKPKKDLGLCVDGGRVLRGETLRLESCSGNQRQNWFYNDNRNDEIAPMATAALCVASNGGNLQAGDTVILDNCNGEDEQGWKFRVDEDKNEEHDLVYLRQAPNFCIGVDGSVERNARLVTKRCDRGDDNMLWDFDDDRSWRPKSNNDLCVVLNAVQELEQLRLEDCRSGSFRRWRHDENSLWEITPFTNSNLCATYGTGDPSLNQFIETRRCDDLGNTQREWNYCHEEDANCPPGRGPPGPTRAPTPTPGGSVDDVVMIPLRYNLVSNSDFCMGLQDDASNGAELSLVICNTNSNTQRFTLSSDGTWRPRNDNTLCVNVNQVRVDQRLYLEQCNRADNSRWDFHANGNRQIWPRSDGSLCASYGTGNPSNGDRISLMRCSDLFAQEKEWELLQLLNQRRNLDAKANVRAR